MEGRDENVQMCWYAMRDLSRRHAKEPAYRILADMGYEFFTPMTRKLVIERGRRLSKDVPVMPDLLFVHATRARVDEAVARIKNLQYRYTFGGYCRPMVVRDEDMALFVNAVKSSDRIRYFRPDEITESMLGEHVRIIGGSLDGYEGRLVSIRGSKYRRLKVELRNFLTAAIYVQPEFIEVVKTGEQSEKPANDKLSE